MQVDFVYPDGREGLLDQKTKKLRSWIFDLRKRLKENSNNFKKRVMAQNKKVVEIDSIMMLNTYTADMRKSKLKQ
jgi:hypothetical protein